MGKKLLVIFSVIVFGASPVLAFAQEHTAANNAVVQTDETTTVNPSHIAVTSSSDDTAEKAHTAAIRQELKDAKSTMHTEMSEARAAFKEKLQAIKDQRKQIIVTNLDSRLNQINQRRTQQMTERLNRLSSVLDNISSKEATLATQGKNTTLLKSDIATAKTAIDTAKMAVTTQAAKDYIMSITTDTALKNSASTTIQQFFSDIKVVYLKVVAAQTAVIKAHKDVSQLMGTTITPSPTVLPATP